uniref:Uncharacterized protein n=1 Tax=Solanum lycopersicum TaxID=4081 RepID=A0A3Q7GGF5_SOLLC
MFRVNHTMMDVSGFKMFINALSELIQGASTPSILPIWKRHLLSARISPCIIYNNHFFSGNMEMEVIKINAFDLHPKEIVRFTLLMNIRGKSLNFELSKAGLLCSNSLTYAVELAKNLKDNMHEDCIKSIIVLFQISSDNKYVGFDEFDFGWGNPIFGGVPKAISVNSFGIAINLPPLIMEKFQQVIYKTLRNVKESIQF